MSKLDSARTALEGTTVNVDEFLKKLAAFYGYEDPAKLTSEELESATWEDLEECGLPKGKARQIAKIFRGSEKKEETVVKVDISNDPEKHAATLTPVQLVDHYDPDNHTNPYGSRLKEVTEDLKCLAFNEDGSFNREISKQLVQEIVDGYPARFEITINGLPLQTYHVGNRPDRIADENPAVPGQLLRPNGVSDVGCNWGEIDLSIRQLVYLAVKETGETGKDSEMDIFDRIENKDFAQVAQRYRKASVKFQERKKLGTLPMLKLRLGKDGDRPNNPFGSKPNRAW
jgi:hypothetical protein